jgi:hypothetical protein
MQNPEDEIARSREKGWPSISLTQNRNDIDSQATLTAVPIIEPIHPLENGWTVDLNSKKLTNNCGTSGQGLEPHGASCSIMSRMCQGSGVEGCWRWPVAQIKILFRACGVSVLAQVRD